MNRPWSGEFPNDHAEGMDAAAIRILLANIKAGKASEADIRADVERLHRERYPNGCPLTCEACAARVGR